MKTLWFLSVVFLLPVLFVIRSTATDMPDEEPSDDSAYCRYSITKTKSGRKLKSAEEKTLKECTTFFIKGNLACSTPYEEFAKKNGEPKTRQQHIDAMKALGTFSNCTNEVQIKVLEKYYPN